MSKYLTDPIPNYTFQYPMNEKRQNDNKHYYLETLFIEFVFLMPTFMRDRETHTEIETERGREGDTDFERF